MIGTDEKGSFKQNLIQGTNELHQSEILLISGRGGEMEEAESIVKMLNAPPLELGIGAMDFCQKSPMELRELLHQVLSAILPPQRVDDAPEAKISWMMELLRVLNYRPNCDGITFREGIASGSTDVIYQLLPWLLSQMTMLQKRAYLARFLIDVEIPAELLLEEDMNLLHAQYNGIREQFKATHRHLDSLRQIERDPNKVKERVQQLETERDHLQIKIIKVKSKLQDVEKFGDMLEVVSQLKTLRVDESTLAEALKEQIQGVAESLGKQQKATSKLAQMQALAVSANKPAFLQKIAQENSILHHNAKEKLIKEVEKKQLHLRALQEVLAKDSIPDGLGGIQAKLLPVNEEIRSLRKKHGLEVAQNSSEVLKGEVLQWQQAQMGATIASKLQEALEKLESLKARRDQLLKDIDQKNLAIDEVKATVRRGEDFKQYVDQLRSKSATYKKAKKDIDDLAAEYGVLLRTQQQLEQQLERLPSTTGSVAQDGTTLLGDIDHADTTQSAHNLKEVIAEIDKSVKEIKCKVTPQANNLKLLRSELEELEAEHEEKKQHYTEVQSVSERKLMRLEADIASSSKALEIDTKALNDNTTTIERLQASVAQLSMEKHDRIVSAQLSSKIGQQEELLSSLHQKQQKLKETKHSNLEQMAMMKDLLTLLAAKLAMYSSGSKPAIFSTATSLETVDK